MRSLTGWRAVRREAGAVFALLAGVLAAPPAAFAGCGDYVVRKSDGRAEHRAMAPADHAGKAEPPGPAPWEGRGPCQGPQCSRQSQPPLLPAPVSVAEGEHWACVNGRPHPAGPDFAGRLLDEQRPRPTHHRQPIYHPPRPSTRDGRTRA